MQQSFEYLLRVLSDSTKTIAFDVETTGLNPRTSKAFMCSFAWSEDGKDHTATWFFDGTPADKELMRALCTKPKTILAHNAKFEMGFLYEQFGLFVDVPIWDTMVMARVQFNNHMSYSLEKCGERINAPKIDLKKYMDEHGMVSGRAPNKVYHYDRVPRDVITEYCENDALVSLLLYKSQVATFREWESVGPSVAAVVKLELATTKNLFEMERRGLRLDQRLCHEAYSHEQGRALAAHSWLSRYMERPFVDSANELLDPMLAEGIQPSHTEKGGLSFDSETLASKTSEFARQVLAHRDASKRATTYFGNFLELLSPNGRIHPSIFQVGAASGRFSVRDPSCQNWPDDWGKDGWTTPYPVRRVFIPDDGCRIVSFDYAAMELRVMADEADEMQLIHDIQNGVDFHQKLADSAGITRGVAKCIAKGTPILTDVGLVPIEEITLEHRVWDGEEFVTHEGILSRGPQETITYDGICATKDHRVFTQCGRIVELSEARRRKLRLAITEINGNAIRLTDNKQPYTQTQNLIGSTARYSSLFGCDLSQLWRHIRNLFGQSTFWQDNDVSLPDRAQMGWRQNHAKSYRALQRYGSTLQQSFKRRLFQIWGAWDKITHLKERLYRVVCGRIEKSCASTALRYRPHRQQWALRTLKYTLGFSSRKQSKQAHQSLCGLQRAKNCSLRLSKIFSEGLSRLYTQRCLAHTFSLAWPFSRRNSSTPKRSLCSIEKFSDVQRVEKAAESVTIVEVFDIINAGPRRRFTANGKLVKNSARFSSLYGAGHKKLAKILSLPESKAKSILDELRLQTPNITMYSRRLIKYAETNGCATNWLGRRYFFDSKFAYKFPNYRIQGGCSEILRFAIDSVTKFVSAHRKGNTYLMLPIHDELVLNVDGGDMGLLPTIRVLMIEAYKAKKHLDMDVACAVGNNFADVEAYSLESTAGKTL